MTKLFTAPEVAEILRSHRETVLRWCREGLLKCVRLNGKRVLITEEELQRFIDQGGAPAKK